MRNYEIIKEAIEKAITTEQNLKITNELLLDIREALLKDAVQEEYQSIAIEPKQEELDGFEDVSVYHLPISTRLKSTLLGSRIVRLSQLRYLSVYDVLRLRNMGSKTAKELVQVLKNYGIDMPEFP